MTYGSELWILKLSDIDALDNERRYSGKRIQQIPNILQMKQALGIWVGNLKSISVLKPKKKSLKIR